MLHAVSLAAPVESITSLPFVLYALAIPVHGVNRRVLIVKVKGHYFVCAWLPNRKLPDKTMNVTYISSHQSYHKMLKSIKAD